MNPSKNLFLILLSLVLGACSSTPTGDENNFRESYDETVVNQREALDKNTSQKGFGPQSPRDIDKAAGTNPVIFSEAPSSEKMNLCNIHFHKNAEHKGGEFTKYAGKGDGKGKDAGYLYSGKLTQKEKSPVNREVCPGKFGSLNAGDTIELHYVYSTAMVEPGPTLGACLSESIKNPQLRVEAQVLVLVNDRDAADFEELTQVGKENDFHQAVNLPNNTGRPVVYAGSTTGPTYNEQGSPFQVTWGVRPEVIKVGLLTVEEWCKGNVFNEDHAHGVRNLVINPRLLSEIED